MNQKTLLTPQVSKKKAYISKMKIYKLIKTNIRMVKR